MAEGTLIMWKLKTDAQGNAVLQDGKPVYIDADGKEHVFDIAANQAKINGLNSESRTHRERAEAAEGKLKSFEGITDPAAALKAMQTVAGLNEKDLIKAGDRDAAVRAAVDAVEAKYAPIVKQHGELQTQLNTMLIGGAFSGSKFVAEKFQAKGPAGVEIAKSLFGQHFKVEDGKLVAYGADGNKLYSPTRHGQLADADEAIELLVSSYPHKEAILAGSQHSGGGTPPGGQGGQGGKRTLTREQFEALPPAERMTAAKDAVITD